MMKNLWLIAMTCSALLVSCSKEPGEGGRAEIRGLLYEQRYNGSSLQGQPYPIADARVAIIYGDGEYADDDTRTGPNGEFRFAWLRKGDYRLYAISECQSCPSGEEGVYVDVTITGRKQVVNVGTITIRNY
ncbi:MAG: carboxypeptidase regulatory-like domain-containing protein [Flavobacteriales bacterium]|nr:carboxypeptidase regulatory-like domain-containing protein [Flavobacteriales bacterium]